jgi:antitoxin MazE
MAQMDKSLPMPRSEKVRRRKIFKSGNSIVVSLPRAFLQALNLEQGSEVSVSLDRERGVMVLGPAMRALRGVDDEFGRQVAEFIEEYRPALEALASGASDDC